MVHQILADAAVKEVGNALAPVGAHTNQLHLVLPGKSQDAFSGSVVVHMKLAAFGVHVFWKLSIIFLALDILKSLGYYVEQVQLCRQNWRQTPGPWQKACGIPRKKSVAKYKIVDLKMGMVVLITNTGISEVRTTFSVLLLNKHSRNPLAPCEPITTRSISFSYGLPDVVVDFPCPMASFTAKPSK